jgi:hypothetical protein
MPSYRGWCGSYDNADGVAEGGINGAVKAEADNAAIEWMPRTFRAGRRRVRSRMRSSSPLPVWTTSA